jgi:GNAT superfamily N-acetyltransferase
MHSLTIEPTTQTRESGIHEDFHRFIKDIKYEYKGTLCISLMTQYNEKLHDTLWNRILFDGKMIGMMVIESPKASPFKKIYALQHLFLKPEYRGKGIGTYILSYVIEEYRGYPVFLSCYNKRLSQFYGKNGFKYMAIGDLSPTEKKLFNSNEKYVHCTEKITQFQIRWAEQCFNF